MKIINMIKNLGFISNNKNTQIHNYKKIDSLLLLQSSKMRKLTQKERKIINNKSIMDIYNYNNDFNNTDENILMYMSAFIIKVNHTNIIKDDEDDLLDYELMDDATKNYIDNKYIKYTQNYNATNFKELIITENSNYVNNCFIKNAC
jgi:hypothetical protein